MPTLYLHTDEASGFTTVGAALSAAQYDSTMIQLKAEIDAVVTTLDGIGSHVQNTDTFLNVGGSNQVSAEELRGIADTYLTPTGSEASDILVVNSGGTAYVTSPQTYGMYFENANAAVTVISAAGTFENINCVLAEGDVAAVGLSVGVNVVTYDGVGTIKLQIEWSASLFKTGGGAGDECALGIFVNGIQVSGEAVRDVDNSSLGNLGGSWIIEVSAAQDIAFKVTNKDSTSNIIVQDQLITLTKIH